MNAGFTALALGYCAGRGLLKLKGTGSSARPWLAITRTEDQQSYLDHQLRQLRKRHEGTLRAVIERQSGSGYYDILRLRAGSEQFWRTYELLYPQDVRCWSQQSASLSGTAGLVNLWLDHGSWLSKTTALIKPPWRSDELMAWIEVLHDAGVRCAPKISSRSGEIEAIGLGVSGTESLIKLIRPAVHRTMRRRLWAQKMLGSAHVLAH